MPESSTPELARFSEKPNLASLIKLFSNTSPVYNGWNRLQNNEEVRFARWSPQWADNRRYNTSSTPAKPWDGASDVRVFLADDTINELKAVLCNAFWRSMELVEGVEQSDEERAAHIKNLFRHMLGTRQKRELAREVELSADYLLSYGRCILHPHWLRKLDMELREFSLEQLQAAIAQMPPDHPLAVFAMNIMDPAMEDALIEQARELAGQLVQTHFEHQLKGDVNDLLSDYRISRKRAAKLVRDLRTKGKAKLPVPYFCANHPSICALKPWEECFLPAGATDIQRGPVFHVQWLTEEELRARSLLEGWGEEWTEAALDKKGSYSAWTEDGMQLTSDPDARVAPGFEQDPALDKVEVIHACYWQLDEQEDIRWSVVTTFHAGISDKWARHQPLDLPHKSLPYVLGLLERVDRRIDASRSLPERLASRQRELKVQRDALIDLTSISVVPPVIEYDIDVEVQFQYGPLARNQATPGREPQFMEIKGPGNPLALELWDRVEKEVDNAVGRLSEDVPAPRAQAKLQMLINTFLLMWTEAFQQQFALMQAYLPEGEYQRITGDPQPLETGEPNNYDFILSFDARELDLAHVAQQLEAITKGLLPFDKTNVINTGKFITAALRAINPNLMREIVSGPQEGIEARKQAVQANLMKMSAGFDPDYLEDDNPAAQIDMQLAQQMMMANPKLQQQAQGDPDFQEKLKKYSESLMFNIQQQQNKQVGRIGVK